MTKNKRLELAQTQARLSSRSWGIAYVHYFPIDDSYQVSIAHGSGKYVTDEYKNGRHVQHD